MTTKAAFNAEEWSTLVEAPLLAAMKVVAASRGGTIRESLAVGQAYAKARREHGDSELLDGLVASPPAMDPSRAASLGDIGRAADERLRAAASLLGEKATAGEAEDYRHFVISVARAAAEAHREGGFLGVGGQDISEAERTALDEIAATLQVAP